MIPPLLTEYGITRSLWLTATLPFPARMELRGHLPQVLEIGSFALSSQVRLRIEQTPWEVRTARLLRWLREKSGFGIIFVPTREGTLRLARLVEAVGKKVVQYHAGMSIEERQNTENLIAAKVPEVIVATSAFGMGMDYAHLNYVVLWQAPPSLLALVQTIGRVGRDERQVGEALVLWDHEDFKLLEWTLQNSERRRDDLMALIKFFTAQECRQVSLKKYFNPSTDLASELTACGRCDFCWARC